MPKTTMTSSSSLPSDMPDDIGLVHISDGLVHMNDPHAPFIHDAVSSKKTDPFSIRSGEFIMENIEIAHTLKHLREKLQKRPELQDVEFSISSFENWGKTIKNLLLYVKPKTRQNVCDIIKAAKEFNIKVIDT